MNKKTNIYIYICIYVFIDLYIHIPFIFSVWFHSQALLSVFACPTTWPVDNVLRMITLSHYIEIPRTPRKLD